MPLFVIHHRMTELRPNETLVELRPKLTQENTYMVVRERERMFRL